MIRKINELDFNELIKLYQSFFKEHNRFKKSSDEIIKYLKTQSNEKEFLIYNTEEGIKGALIIVKKGEDSLGNHKIWKFRHFAFDSEEVGSKLLDEAEKILLNKSKTVKIEQTIAENEKGLNLYLSNGYEKEGVLKNHYRWGESCYIVSKSLF